MEHQTPPTRQLPPRGRSLRPQRQPRPTPAAVHDDDRVLTPNRSRLTIRGPLTARQQVSFHRPRRLKKCESEQVALIRRLLSTGVGSAGQAVETRHSDRRTRGARGGRGNTRRFRDLYRRLQERRSVPQRRSSSRPTASGISTMARLPITTSWFSSATSRSRPNEHALPGSLATATRCVSPWASPPVLFGDDC